MKNVTTNLIKSSILILMFILPLLTVAQVQTQDRNVGSFTGIHQTTSADIFVTKGSTVSVKVKADADRIDYITTDVSNGILTIGTNKNMHDSFWNIKTLEVYITMPKLENLENSGSGDIEIDGEIPGDNVVVKISGSGDLDADLAAKNLKLMIAGSGDVELSGVRGDFLIKIAGSGDVETDNLTLDDCEIEVAGSGDIRLKGKAARLSVKLAGSGDINCYGLVAANVNIKSNGSGDLVVNAAEKINAVLNGSGDLTYYGSPEYVDVESNGSGEVYRK